jgi:hypothetical protein
MARVVSQLLAEIDGVQQGGGEAAGAGGRGSASYGYGEQDGVEIDDWMGPNVPSKSG